MGFFQVFANLMRNNPGIFSNLEEICSGISELISLMNTSIEVYQRKLTLTKEFTLFDKASQIKKADEFKKEFMDLISGAESLSRKEYKFLKKDMNSVAKMMKNVMQEKKTASLIQANLEVLLADLVELNNIIIKEKEFFIDLQKKLENEPQYLLRQITLLLNKEYEIIYRHSTSNQFSEIEVIGRLKEEIRTTIEAWRPEFMGTLQFKEIVEPDDPDFIVLYNDVFDKCFKGDISDFETFKEELINYRDPKSVKYHIILIKNSSGKIIAGAAFYFFVIWVNEMEMVPIGLDDHLAVLPEYRRYSLGTSLAAVRLKILNNDTKLAGGRHVKAIFGEYEKEYDGIMDPVERKKFWQKMHMRGIDLPYKTPNAVESPSGKGWDSRTTEESLTIGLWQLNKETEIDTSHLLDLLTPLYTKYYGISENHNIFRHLKTIFSKKKKIKIVPLVDQE